MAQLYVVQSGDYDGDEIQKELLSPGGKRNLKAHLETFDLPSGELEVRMRELLERILTTIKREGTLQPGAGTLGFNQLIVREQELRGFMKGSPLVQVRASTSTEKVREGLEVAANSFISNRAEYQDPSEKEIWMPSTGELANIRKQIVAQRKARSVISVHLSTPPQDPKERVRGDYWELPDLNQIWR